MERIIIKGILMGAVAGGLAYIFYKKGFRHVLIIGVITCLMWIVLSLVWR